MPVATPVMTASKLYADFVEQTTTTTGNSGVYELGPGPAGRRNFVDVFDPGDSIAYVVTDDAGNFECGIGIIAGGNFDLRSMFVTSSSNANAAVNWAAGTKRIYCAMHSGLSQGVVKHNFTASAAPSNSTDGINAGYSPGSLWMNGALVWIYTGSTNGWVSIA